MGFSVADIFTATLLIVNALAILSERRFLAPMGLANADGAGASPGFNNNGGTGASGSPAFFPDDGFGSPGSGGGKAIGGGELKSQINQLLSSVRMLLRWPLIVLNAVAILFALIFG